MKTNRLAILLLVCLWVLPSNGAPTTGSGYVAPTTGGGGGLGAGFTFTDCSVLWYPGSSVTDEDDVTSVFRAHVGLTITEVWCETDTGTVDMDVQVDDGVTPVDVIGTDLTCAVSPGDSETTLAAPTMSAGDTLDWAITTVDSGPSRLTVCIKYTI